MSLASVRSEAHRSNRANEMPDSFTRDECFISGWSGQATPGRHLWVPSLALLFKSLILRSIMEIHTVQKAGTFQHSASRNFKVTCQTSQDPQERMLLGKLYSFAILKKNPFLCVPIATRSTIGADQLCLLEVSYSKLIQET